MFLNALPQRSGEQSTVLSQARLIPVFHLPFEVLAEVFGYLQTRIDYGCDDINEAGYHPSLLWIPQATHVCHTWREVALNTPVLWQDIDVTASPSWAIEFARRSKNVPLRISASTSRLFSKEKMGPVIRECVEKLIQASVERVHTIVLGVHDAKGLLSRSSSSANGCVTFPILRCLEVSTFEEEFILSDDSLCAPSLEDLYVRDFCTVDWKAFSLFQSLSYFNMCTALEAPLFDLGAMHKALCQMPNLIVLYLCPLFKDEPEAIVIPLSPCQPASLPKLRRMHLTTFNPTWLSFILHCIAYGPERDLVINATYDENANFEELFSNIPSIMQHVKESSIRSLRIRISTGNFFFTGSRHLDAVHESNFDISIRMPTSLQPPSSYPFGLGVYLLDASLRTVHFQCLESLTLGLQEPVPAKIWVRLFGHLPDLSKVDIETGLRELCAALVNDIEDAPGRDGIPFRVLQSITVKREKGLYSDKDIDYMRGCLRKRLDLELPLKEVCITFDIKDYEMDIGMLKEFVVGTSKV